MLSFSAFQLLRQDVSRNVEEETVTKAERTQTVTKAERTQVGEDVHSREVKLNLGDRQLACLDIVFKKMISGN